MISGCLTNVGHPIFYDSSRILVENSAKVTLAQYD